MSRGDCSVDDQYSGQSAAHVAAQNGHIDVLRCLIQHNANMEEEVRQSVCSLSIFSLSVCVSFCMQSVYMYTVCLQSVGIRISGICETYKNWVLGIMLLLEAGALFS